MTLNAPSQAPHAISGRLQSIDMLRGFALGGVLLINLWVISGTPLSSSFNSQSLDGLAGVLIRLLVEGKFFPLFAGLFGWGLARQQHAGWSMPLLVRRMAVLALIGLAHALLIWPGDILFAYALIGLLVLALRRAPARALVLLAGLCLVITSLQHLPGPTAAYAGWVAPVSAMLRGQIDPSALPGSTQLIVPETAGLLDRYGAFVLDNARTYALKLIYLPFWAGDFAGLVLLGFAAGREGWLERIIRARQPATQQTARHTADLFVRWKHIWPILLLVGLALNGYYTWLSAFPTSLPPEWREAVGHISKSIGGPLLGFIYAVGFACWMRSPRWVGRLANLGRASLSTYLMQSLIGVIIFNGLGAKITPVLLIPLAALIYLLQMSLAQVWLARISHGPVEMVWRWLAHVQRR